ncbi:hypothetical protein CMI40_02235 [Candidatus Pacearchaeota archaeon]|jgi:hypothetical protein|nr:hypothetical protein [Candidatus Pacearchaeota archaeon]|tara:strand:- start:2129 stop:2368 length:240 start_codon:yes stop_codon:yes gene_type:complete
MNNKKEFIRKLEKCMSDMQKIVNKGGYILQEEITNFSKCYKVYENLIQLSKSILLDKEAKPYQKIAMGYNEEFWRSRAI